MSRKENERDQKKREKGEGHSKEEKPQRTGKEELLGVIGHRQKAEKIMKGTRRGVGMKGSEDHYILFLLLNATKHKGIQNQTAN